jgi:hypothetical protein
MTSPTDVPYSDPEPLSELIEECRCVEAECAAHGVNLHPAHHNPAEAPHEPVVIGEKTQHIVDGYSDYGS